MKSTLVRSCLLGTLAAALLVVAACSGMSGSLPTSPSLSSGARATFQITDPCAPASLATITEPPPPPPPACNGRFTGGGFQVTGDIKVTRGFELHCDALLSNNFEVNWPAGNNFHIDKNQSAVCSLLANPNPPDAPVNRIEVNGTGTLNGVEGATVRLVLIDNGEKANAPADQAYIEINGVAITGGTPAAPAPIDGGNIQAHFDQPHK